MVKTHSCSIKMCLQVLLSVETTLTADLISTSSIVNQSVFSEGRILLIDEPIVLCISSFLNWRLFTTSWLLKWVWCSKVFSGWSRATSIAPSCIFEPHQWSRTSPLGLLYALLETCLCSCILLVVTNKSFMTASRYRTSKVRVQFVPKLLRI